MISESWKQISALWQFFHLPKRVPSRETFMLICHRIEKGQKDLEQFDAFSLWKFVRRLLYLLNITLELTFQWMILEANKEIIDE